MLEKIISLILAIVAVFSGFTVKESDDGIIRYRNMPYGIRYRRQILDLNIPASVKGDAKLIMFIHGGAWTSGSKDDSESSLDSLSERGIVTAAINYRYCGKPNYATIRDIMDDITSALAKIKEVAAENGIDLTGVMFDGGSAGAHLSLLYAYAMADEAPIPPVAVVAKSPVTDFTDFSLYDGSLHELDTEKWCIPREQWSTILTYMTGEKIKESDIEKHTDALHDISPITYVDENSVPTIIAHGTMDTVLPYANSVALDEKLTQYGIDHRFITFEGAWHGLQDCPEGSAELGRAYEEFICEYIEK